MKKHFILTLVLLASGIYLKAQTYISLDKGTIEKETHDLTSSQTTISNYFTVYTVTPHITNKTSVNKNLKKEIIKSSEVIDVIINAQKNKLVIYSKYRTDASTIKNILYRLNFVINDYNRSYAVKNKNN